MEQEGIIFINYRRDDSRPWAGRLQDHLEAHFGPKSVFRDLGGIDIGADFKAVIENAIRRAKVFLALIGDRWLEQNSSGARRIDAPDDLVRKEIELALKSKSQVIVPVHFQAAKMPGTAELPESIRKLADSNAVHLTDEHWKTGVGALIERIEAVLQPSKMVGQQIFDLFTSGSRAPSFVGRG